MRVNIPTALSKRETQVIKKLSKDKNCLEIGSLLGYSTVNIGQCAKSMTSIDLHENYPYIGAESTLNKFKNNLKKYNINNVKIIKDNFENVDIGLFDFLFIDLDGTFETTKKVLEKVRHIPLITIHDYSRQNCSGVAESIKQSNSELIQVIDTCAIIENRRR